MGIAGREAGYRQEDQEIRDTGAGPLQRQIVQLRGKSAALMFRAISLLALGWGRTVAPLQVAARQECLELPKRDPLAFHVLSPRLLSGVRHWASVPTCILVRVCSFQKALEGQKPLFYRAGDPLSAGCSHAHAFF